MTDFVTENKMVHNLHNHLCRVEKRVVGLGEGTEDGLDSKLGPGTGVETELRVGIGGPGRTEDVYRNALETSYPAFELDKLLW